MHCVLHIGTEKTATTLLQEWLYANKAELSSQGIFLSAVAQEGNNRRLVSWCQSQVDDWLRRQGVTTLEQKAELLQDFEAQFREEVAAASQNHHTMVLTSEHFHSRLHTDEEIARVKTLTDELFDSITVVCYFRDQADMAVSLHSTLLRIAAVKPLEKYLEGVDLSRRNYNHARTSAQWADIFGEQNCRFRVFDRGSFPQGDIRRDFLQTLPTPPDFDDLNATISSANESLGRYQARLYLTINKAIPHWRPGKNGVNKLNRRLKKTIDGVASLGKVPLPRVDRDAVRQRFADSNRRFLARWAPDRSDLLDNGAPRSSRAEGTDDQPTEEMLADLLTALVSDHIQTDRFLAQEDAQTLMAIYWKYIRARPRDREGALALLQLAARAHPKGPRIRRLLDEATGNKRPRSLFSKIKTRLMKAGD